jgi:hypothetical protein
MFTFQKAGCSKVVAAAAKLLPLLLPRMKTVFVLMVTRGRNLSAAT